jgi:hypothetical protein
MSRALNVDARIAEYLALADQQLGFQLPSATSGIRFLWRSSNACSGSGRRRSSGPVVFAECVTLVASIGKVKFKHCPKGGQRSCS